MKNRYSFKTDDAGQPTILDKKEKKKVHALVPVLCLLCAVLIWLYVAGNDAGMTRTFVVPVTVENESVLLEQTNLRVWFTETPTVIVVLRGRDVFLDKVSANNITAVLNAENLTSRGTLTIDVDIRLDEVNKSVTVDNMSAQSMTVLVDFEKSKEIPVSAVLLAPSAVSRRLSATVDPELLTIKGPESVVNMISAGQISVYTEVTAGQVLTDRVMTYLDSNGTEVNHAFLPNVSYGTTAVSVTVVSARE